MKYLIEIDYNSGIKFIMHTPSGEIQTYIPSEMAGGILEALPQAIVDLRKAKKADLEEGVEILTKRLNMAKAELEAFK